VDCLLIVDFQNDFTPGGALPVEGGHEIAEPLNRLARSFDLVVATRDWHPADHASFTGTDVDAGAWHGVDPPSIWPPHCVQATPGADLHPSLDQAEVDVVLDKGQDPHSQGYSAFQDTDLDALLRARGATRLFVGGLATDYCVKHTVLDARRHGFEVVVVTDAIRGIEAQPGDNSRAIAEMIQAGATTTTSSAVEEAVRPDRPGR
jgi:nicotinamidase/pyrazinamidase